MTKAFCLGCVDPEWSFPPKTVRVEEADTYLTSRLMLLIISYENNLPVFSIFISITYSDTLAYFS